MKQIFYFAAFMAVSFFVSNYASAQYDHRWNDAGQRGNQNCNDNRQQSFYYYPQSNVYYSINTQQYIYSYQGSWVVSNRLPHQWRLRDEPRFVVNHYGFDVWNENRFHAARFGTHRYGQPDVAYAQPQGRYDDRNHNNNWQDNDRRDNDYRGDYRRK